MTQPIVDLAGSAPMVVNPSPVPSETLWPELEPLVIVAEEVEKLSPGRRLTLRQKTDVEAGRHPLTRHKLSDDPAATCGNCRFRVTLGRGASDYPKCVYGDGAPRATHSASSDVRAWWPGCRDHEYGDSKLSPDAARSGPVSS